MFVINKTLTSLRSDLVGTCVVTAYSNSLNLLTANKDDFAMNPVTLICYLGLYNGEGKLCFCF